MKAMALQQPAPRPAAPPAAAAAAGPSPPAPRLRHGLRRALRVLGWPGVVGIGVLVMVATFVVSALLPERARLLETQRSVAALREQMGQPGQPGASAERSAAEQLADFYRLFPSEKDLPDWLAKIFAAAQAQGLVLEQGEYKTGKDKLGRLMHYDITLPVKGEYPQIRRFLAGVAKEVPIAALEQVQFERQKVGVATVDCKIKLTLYLERRT